MYTSFSYINFLHYVESSLLTYLNFFICPWRLKIWYCMTKKPCRFKSSKIFLSKKCKTSWTYGNMVNIFSFNINVEWKIKWYFISGNKSTDLISWVSTTKKLTKWYTWGKKITIIFGRSNINEINIYICEINIKKLYIFSSHQWEKKMGQEIFLFTECPKIYRKSVLHMLRYIFVVYLSRSSTDLR